MEQGEYNIYYMVSDFQKHKCKFITAAKNLIWLEHKNINIKTYSPEGCRNGVYS